MKNLRLIGLATLVALLLPALALAAEPQIELRSSTPPGGAIRGMGDPPINLILDDDTAEVDFGVNGAAAEQFLWFNRFDHPGAPFLLQEVRVLFVPGANIAVGNPIDLAIYSDNDGDPTNGATLLGTYTMLQIEDDTGASFSEYTLDPPIEIVSSHSILVGVIPRFIQSGITSPTLPAAGDNSMVGNSWYAIWTDDPPASPDLPPDLLIANFPSATWMIRAAGRPLGATEIPTLGTYGLLSLVVGLGLLAVFRLRRLG